MYESAPWLTDLKQLEKEIEKQIKRLNERIKKAPEGSLRISRKWNKNQYYHRHDSSNGPGIYIPRNNKSFAARLAQKDYDARLLDALKDQKEAIDRFLKDFNPDEAQQVFTHLTAARLRRSVCIL